MPLNPMVKVPCFTGLLLPPVASGTNFLRLRVLGGHSIDRFTDLHISALVYRGVESTCACAI